MADIAIELDHVTRRFGEMAAVNAVSLEVQKGEVFGLLGHNGAGKTTLIRVLNGLLPPSSGSARVLGYDPSRDGDRVRARCGVLTEYPALDHFLTCRENLAVYATVYGLDARQAGLAADAALEDLELTDHAHVLSHALSAGLKQRVALARALVHGPELLLLDEPTSNLDPLAGRTVRELVTRLARDEGGTVLMSTHNLAEAQAMCDRIAILQNGRLLAIGTVSELGEHLDRRAVDITVAPGHADRAAKALADAGVHSTLAEDVTLRVPTDYAAVPTLVACLVDAAVDIHAVRPLEPTLEDIYVGLHSRPAPSREPRQSGVAHEPVS